MRSNRFDVRWLLFAQVLSSLFSNPTFNLRKSNKTFIQLLFLLTLETYITNCRFGEVKMCLAFEFRWKIQYKFWDNFFQLSFSILKWIFHKKFIVLHNNNNKPFIPSSNRHRNRLSFSVYFYVKTNSLPSIKKCDKSLMKKFHLKWLRYTYFRF